MHNRIRSYTRRFEVAQPAVASAAAITPAVATTPSSSLVMVPATAFQATWQAQLYRMAYERAAADLAPPRHHRFFTVWN